MRKSRSETRPVELIIATSDSGDSGFWHTYYVDVSKFQLDRNGILNDATAKFYEENESVDDVVYIGIFALPSESEDWSYYGYDYEEKETDQTNEI